MSWLKIESARLSKKGLYQKLALILIQKLLSKFVGVFAHLTYSIKPGKSY